MTHPLKKYLDLYSSLADLLPKFAYIHSEYIHITGLENNVFFIFSLFFLFIFFFIIIIFLYFSISIVFQKISTLGIWLSLRLMLPLKQKQFTLQKCSFLPSQMKQEKGIGMDYSSRKSRHSKLSYAEGKWGNLLKFGGSWVLPLTYWMCNGRVYICN